MDPVLILADTLRSPELRQEVPVPIVDAFLYVEHGGRRVAVIGSLDAQGVRDAGIDVVAPHELGWDELVQRMSYTEARDELSVRACERFGITRARVPASFPLAAADRLRASGVDLVVDRGLFDRRRRVKTDAQLAGIERAQRGAEAGMDAARALLRRGPGVTCEEIRAAIHTVFTEHDLAADEFIVARGAQAAVGHHLGAGPIAEGESVVIDLWPRDRATACYADMTRTFCIGEPPEELVRWHRLVKDALDRSIAHTRAGVPGRAVFDVVCDLFEAEGFPTQRTKEPGTSLEDGFFHGLGHGVGLEVHEPPSMGISGSEPLLAGDVVTTEPGLYRSGWGGVRLEDVLLVTDDGCRNLTDYPYDLEP